MLLLCSEKSSKFRDDVVNKLYAGGIGEVHQQDVGVDIPEVSMMVKYTAVILFTHEPLEKIKELSDAVASVVEAGVGVVLALYAIEDDQDRGLCGRLMNALSPCGVGPVKSGKECHMIVEGEFPAESFEARVVDRLKSFSGGPESVHCELSVRIGASVVCWWSDGQPLVLQRRHKSGGRVVVLNARPISTDASPFGWDRSSEGMRLLSNIVYAIRDCK